MKHYIKLKLVLWQENYLLEISFLIRLHDLSVIPKKVAIYINETFFLPLNLDNAQLSRSLVFPEFMNRSNRILFDIKNKSFVILYHLNF